ncbi:hypothetical protein E2C01_053321 [Portunus trituberculatus]|uniref:Uncharacterized protein n=1 Tax=Portunus trituberculatus TaxID=210409 RepID=A0A5B7GP64_PORTR|nr:hypothetical protein [Portunus trituberculatus]
MSVIKHLPAPSKPAVRPGPQHQSETNRSSLLLQASLWRSSLRAVWGRWHSQCSVRAVRNAQDRAPGDTRGKPGSLRGAGWSALRCTRWEVLRHAKNAYEESKKKKRPSCEQVFLKQTQLDVARPGETTVRQSTGSVHAVPRRSRWWWKTQVRLQHRDGVRERGGAAEGANWWEGRPVVLVVFLEGDKEGQQLLTLLVVLGSCCHSRCRRSLC